MAWSPSVLWRRHGTAASMVLIGFSLRLVVLASSHAYHISSDQDHFVFGGEMGRIARSIVRGEGFSSPLHGQSGPTAMVGPTYPLLLAAVFKLFGTYTETSAWVILALNSLFSALTCLPIRALGSRVFGPKVGRAAGWTWVFFPYALYWPIRWVWDTSLSALLLALLLLQVIAIQHASRARNWIGLGLLWAVAALTNTTVLSLLPFLLGWLCTRMGSGRKYRLGLVSLAVLALALGLAPWVIRNYLVFGHFVLRSNFGLELYQGNYTGAPGLRAWQLGPAFNGAEMERYRQMGELAYMADKQRVAWQFISSHPAAFAVLILRRLVYFWTGTLEIVAPGHLLASLALYTLVSALALAGLVAALRRRVPEAFVFATVLVVFPLVYYITHPEPRFRHLIEPAMIVLAAYWVTTVPSMLGVSAQSSRRGNSVAKRRKLRG